MNMNSNVIVIFRSNKIKKTEASKKRNFHRFGDFSQHLSEMQLLTYFFHKIMNKDMCTN